MRICRDQRNIDQPCCKTSEQRKSFTESEQPEAPARAKSAAETALGEIEADTRRIDDPVRMYLTQMGEIPLLRRDQEISLAKKIETARMHFRRRVLESDYCIQQAMEILSQVQAGELPFDRTMKISTAENLSKETVTERMPANLTTLRNMVERNRVDWEAIVGTSISETDRRRALRALWRRRRRAATLLEEMSLRTSRVQPLMKKLRHISDKMEELHRAVEASKSNGTPPEDVEVMKEELAGTGAF